MFIERLALTNFRCYRDVGVDLPRGQAVIVGGNAQGKTSLLEAVFVAGATRSPFAAAERQVVRWGAGEDDGLPYSQVSVVLQRSDGRHTVDVVYVQEVTGGNGAAAAVGQGRITKRYRVDDRPCRAMAALGVLKIVLFAPQDLALVDGPPSARRRYLDTLLCLLDRDYCRSLARYKRVLAQRNHLLRRLRGGPGDLDELAFWDDRLAQDGAKVLAWRTAAVEELASHAAPLHGALAGGAGKLSLAYRASVAGEAGTRARGEDCWSPQGHQPAPAPEPSRADDAPTEAAGVGPPLGSGAGGNLNAAPAQLAEAFAEALRAARRVDIARGVTTVGPQRDDIEFRLDGADVRAFGSRGQQRTVALATKLAEAQVMEDRGDAPVVLLDDVLSELDASRRRFLVKHLAADRQTLLSTTDLDTVPAGFRGEAVVLRVEGGNIRINGSAR